jgi:hypothetical protein
LETSLDFLCKGSNGRGLRNAFAGRRGGYGDKAALHALGCAWKRLVVQASHAAFALDEAAGSSSIVLRRFPHRETFELVLEKSAGSFDQNLLLRFEFGLFHFRSDDSVRLGSAPKPDENCAPGQGMN